MTQASQWSADAVVVGGGPSGSAVASVLACGGMRVALVGDGRRPSWAGESLPAGSTPLLESVFGGSFVDDMRDEHMRAYGTRAAWETAELQETDFLASPLGDGWLLDRVRFDERARVAAESAGALVLDGHASWVRLSTGGWRVDAGGLASHAPFLVDATGRSAVIARRQGALAVEGSRLLACIRHLPESGDTVQATTVEAVPEGWWYSTPLPSGGRVVALISDADLVPRGQGLASWWLTSMKRSAIMRQLLPASAFDDAVPPRLYPAGTGWLDTMVGDDWATVGDAAAHFDPLSSQGMLTGILMGARLGRSLLEQDLEAWERDYRMLIDEHVALSDHYYGLVERWPDSAFWQRRVTAVRN